MLEDFYPPFSSPFPFLLMTFHYFSWLLLNPFLCMTFPPTHSSLGCMTLSWRRPMVPRTFSKNPRKEISRASKPKTRAPPRVPRVFQGDFSRIPRVRMINSCLFFPPSQFFSRNSGVQKQNICRRGIPGTLIRKFSFLSTCSGYQYFMGKHGEYQIYSKD